MIRTDKEIDDFLEVMWKRYHDGQLADLPVQVYYDMGRMHALVDSLRKELRKFSRGD